MHDRALRASRRGSGRGVEDTPLARDVPRPEPRPSGNPTGILSAAELRPFDIMLEAKAKDLALLRLREQIAQFAPELAGSVG